jgi:hypothetical protein
MVKDQDLPNQRAADVDPALQCCQAASSEKIREARNEVQRCREALEDLLARD